MTTQTYRTTLDGRTFDVVVDHASLATAPFQSSVEVYRVRKDGSRGHRFSHGPACWRVWATVRDQVEAIQEKAAWDAMWNAPATQHVLDYYHHIGPALRGTTEGAWCAHQIAALKADQRVADIKTGRIKEGPALLAQCFPKIF